ELDRSDFAALHLDHDRALRTLLRRLDAAALQVARIDDPRLALPQELPAVDVADRPVVHLRGHEVVDRAGRIGRMLGATADVAVQQAHVQAGTRLPAIEERKVFGDLLFSEAGPVDRGQARSVSLDDRRADAVGLEKRDAFR